jgi:hypothetical protein
MERLKFRLVPPTPKAPTRFNARNARFLLAVRSILTLEPSEVSKSIAEQKCMTHEEVYDPEQLEITIHV